MTPTPPYTKVKTVRSFEDGTEEIDSHSMHKKLSSVKQEVSQSVETTAASLAADIIACLQHITYHETTELSLQISTDKATGEPTLIRKTWTINKEYYGR